MSDSHSLLFVCLGNICRSPLAEGIFLHQARERGVLNRFVVDSCGLGSWHAGQRPDPRALAVALRNGVELPSIARQFEPSTDAIRFDLILAMDRANVRDLIERGAARNQISLMRSFDPTLKDRPQHELDVPDPYYGSDRGFDDVFAMLTRACEGLLDSLCGERI